MASFKINLRQVCHFRGTLHVLKDQAFIQPRRLHHLKPDPFIFKNLKHKVSPILVTSIRFNSSSPLDDLPPLPPVPTPSELGTELGKYAGEASFESLGLGGWTPVGIVQNCLEFLHMSCGIPWWGTIVIGTAVCRCLMFPLVIKAQRNAAIMNNNLPQLQILQQKMSEARQTGNKLEASRMAHEMMEFMKEKKLNPLTNMLPPLAQAPIFITFFISLRQMANLPLDSMRTGGLYWFADLTVADQFYLLPIITSATLLLTIEVGTDTAKMATLGNLRYLFRALPLVIFPFTINFPGAILCYWVSSNFISLCQVALLRIPRVREYFKIEALVSHKKEDLPVKKKGFVSGIKESMDNMKITREVEARERLDEIRFTKAGRAPLQRTFKHDPTQVKPQTSAAVEAKKRD